jgi:16S rRNA (uracil1498-N3)-methyltransferase
MTRGGNGQSRRSSEARCTVADRCYCPDQPVEGLLTLTGDEARHLARVRRLGPGDMVEVFDGRGTALPAEVAGVGRDRVELAVRGGPLPDRVAPCHLTLATAVPKADRFDWLVEKATELGVARLVPLRTGRSVVDPRATKLDRLRRVIIEAAKQCGRNRLMVLEDPIPWAEFAGREEAEVLLLAHPGGEPVASWPRVGRGGRVALAVGPEGGFSAQEIEAGRAARWRMVGLGRTLLRVETAGLAGSAVILALGTKEGDG